MGEKVEIDVLTRIMQTIPNIKEVKCKTSEVFLNLGGSLCNNNLLSKVTYCKIKKKSEEALVEHPASLKYIIPTLSSR